MSYLTTNYKIEKGLKLGYLTFGIHLAPANSSGYNLCSSASEGCILACLNTAGRGQQTMVQVARVNKTKKLFSDLSQGLSDIALEIKKAIKKALKQGLVPAFRLNLTSDVRWEKLKLPNGNTLFEEFPSVQFYDYTKHADRMFSKLPTNYHLTFSRSENFVNRLQVDKVLSCGGNVAVVFSTVKGEALPEMYNGYKVVDGDDTDLRFLDEKNVIVGLHSKGKAKIDTSGFVVQV